MTGKTSRRTARAGRHYRTGVPLFGPFERGSLFTAAVIVVVGLIVLVYLGGCVEVPDDSRVQRTAVGKYGNGITWNAEEFDRWSEADLFKYQAWNLWDENSTIEGLVDSLRTRNPDLLILAYMNAPVMPEWMLRSRPGTWGATWRERLMPYLAFTTEGDTARPVNNVYSLNVTLEGCRSTMAEILFEFYSDGFNQSDRGIGIMLDTCSAPIGSWLSGRWAAETHGKMDLDFDGIPHREDPDEIEATRLGFIDLIHKIRDRMGPDFIIVANGNLPYTDNEFASLIDGQHYEGFPRWLFGAGEYWRNAMDPAHEFSLEKRMARHRTEAGGPYGIIDAADNNTAGHLAAQFGPEGLFALYRPGLDNMSYRRPWTWNLGRPIGPAVVVGDTITRRFAGGMARVVIGTGRDPMPFSETPVGALEPHQER